MERGFNFKLLVPPRVNPIPGQVSTVKPQEIVEDGGCFVQTLQQGYNKCLDKESNIPFPSMNMVVPTKPTRSDVFKMKVVPPMENEETNCKPSQLYSKLFEEVQKVKYWKVKVDSEAVQKDRKLQENKRTIETQRKAIQELQFGNESLSIKLEDQISENDDLQNKNNATRNLCNILKDTFERSAEKIHLFESEREETHHLFMENSETIQRMNAAFESLRIQAETDRLEMLKVKEDLEEFAVLKEKFEKEFRMKEEEVVILQMKMKDKEKELQAILLNLHETRESCKRLQQAAQQHQEALQRSKQEQESLLESLQNAEQLNEECEESRKAIATALESNKEENAKVIAKKDSSLEELNKIKDQQADKLVQIQATAQEFQTSLTVEIQRAKELELKLTAVTEELDRKNLELGEIKEQKEKKDSQLQILENELDVKNKSIQSLEETIKVVETRTSELTTALEGKHAEIHQVKNKVETMSVENILLEKALGNAESMQNDLKEKANMTERKIKEIEGQLSAAMRRDEKSIKEKENLKTDIVQHEVKYKELLASFNQLQLEKKTILEQIQNESSEANILVAQLKESEAKEMKMKKEIERLQEENHQLREELKSLNAKVEEQGQDTENLQKKLEESCGDLQAELSKKDKQMKTVESKLSNLKVKLESKTKVQDEYQKENKTLKKQIAIETAKSSELENEINKLKEESENVQRSNEEECKNLLDDLETKATSEAELQKKVQKLHLTATDAVKSKEDTEIKCQNKIADMVALMEKHKNQYDKMVEEKDAELDEKKRKDMEATANRTSLELALSQQNIENDRLKEQLKKEINERESLLQEITALKKEKKMSRQLETQDEQLPEPKSKEVRCSETPKVYSSAKMPMFRLAKDSQRKTKTLKASVTPSQTSEKIVVLTPNIHEMENEAPKTPSWSSMTRVAATPRIKETEALRTPSWSSTNIVSATPRIKSYRIRTPPSTGKSVPWGMSTLELDPKSDSSEHNDLLSIAVATDPFKSRLQSSVPAAQNQKVDIFRKIQSPAIQKSPGSTLKLAAMKRMRDAGWTSVTGAEKKKKKTVEKIFA
ncbi:synaptonemal complex protein 1 isoform X1 [Oncorhynchus tshawytscha]|uniref:Synaptonemal complex protein 1 n=2 Tax=Oncorhynchus tshawytscha TaxID=74940 RepID=A0AAZ3QQN3_ONCTS|nr:synaptonemal complex protein 1 isoform X1 [Oncorhynchus tshawytscha]XP_042174417.1 synaptonemal complex protein 1 isoform X1 [Oncorhynchus tshawytscha]